MNSYIRTVIVCGWMVSIHGIILAGEIKGTLMHGKIFFDDPRGRMLFPSIVKAFSADSASSCQRGVLSRFAMSKKNIMERNAITASS